ncbi:MAG: hypothetical protein AAFZ52_03345, partial [Bacteroidota bacterium]
ATIQFLPSFRFTGTDDWRSQTFAGDGDHGLFRPPFDFSDNTWCSYHFKDPDNENQFLDNGLPTPNAPLHSSPAPYLPWYAYQQHAEGMDRFINDERRLRDHGPFGDRYARKLPATGQGQGGYNFNLPTIEFLQHDAGHMPPELFGYSVRPLHVELSPVEILAVQPLQIEALPQPGPGNPGFQPLMIKKPLVFVGSLANIAIGGNGQVLAPGGQPNPNPVIPNLPGDINQGFPGYVPLVDFTEWVAFKDYIAYRELIDEGVLELAEQSGTVGNGSFLINPDNYPLECDDVPPLPGNEQQYSFWLRYYKPIRAFFDQKYNDPGFPYHPRPAGNTTVRLEGKSLTYDHPKLN